MLRIEVSDFTHAAAETLEGTQVLVCDPAGRPIVLVTEIGNGGYVVSDYRDADFSERLRLIDRVAPTNIERVTLKALDRAR